MKRIKRIKRVDKLSVRTILIERWQPILILSLFCAGVFIGSYYINHAQGPGLEKLTSALLTWKIRRGEISGGEIFKTALIKNGLFMLVTYVLGLSGIGLPLILLTPPICGALNGVVTGYLYATDGLKGLIYSVTTIYPSLIIFIGALTLGTCESMNMSCHLFKVLINKNYIGQGESLKKYSLQFAILTIVLLVSCLIEVLTVKAFY